VPAWLIWSIVALALAVGEILTPGLFFLGPVAVAGVAAAVAAAVGAGWVIDLIVFVAGAAASLAFLRPIARRHVRLPLALRTGAAALVGAPAVVVERVDAAGGRVKIGGEVFEPGTKVQVAEIEGATALVYV
jgi:membrane protein implicated in regulation of membrane protease activity